MLYLTRTKFETLVDSGTLNAECLSNLRVVAERRAKENEVTLRKQTGGVVVTAKKKKKKNGEEDKGVKQVV